METWKPTEQVNFVGVGLTILIIILLSLFIDIGSLQTWVGKAGIWGPLVFVMLKISTIVIAPLSGAPLYPLAGLLFGFWPGLAYVALGDFLGHSMAFSISRIFGKKLVLKLISNKESGLLARVVDHISGTKGFLQACLIFFAIPEILSYAAGLSRIPYLKFIGILWPLLIILTAVLVYFGSILEPEAKSVLIGFALPLAGVVAILGGGFFFVKAMRK